MLDRHAVSRRVQFFGEQRSLSAAEVQAVLAVLDDAFPFADAVAEADTLHVHARLDSISPAPEKRFTAAGGVPENAADGYIKYAFPEGINLILSSLPVAEDDLLPSCAGRTPRPFLDHLGIDLRRETKGIRALFDSVPAQAEQLAWRHVAQGTHEKPVYCCHTSVGRKHWVYPVDGAPFGRPIEFAYGPLTIHQGKMGCDLRPIDPAHPHARLVAKACSASAGV